MAFHQKLLDYFCIFGCTFRFARMTNVMIMFITLWNFQCFAVHLQNSKIKIQTSLLMWQIKMMCSTFKNHCIFSTLLESLMILNFLISIIDFEVHLQNSKNKIQTSLLMWQINMMCSTFKNHSIFLLYWSL